MKRRLLLLPFILSVCAITIISWKSEPDEVANIKQPAVTAEGNGSAYAYFNQYVAEIYNTAQLHVAGLDFPVFEKAMTGYLNLRATGKIAPSSSVITVVDLSKSSCSKRMWIIDLLKKQLLIRTWVAHGKGSGDDLAGFFSDVNESHASSLGFYVTGPIYFGKHGRSLKLDGLDAGFNDHARARGIVVHAASYVSQGTINALGRLGRSEGCPAVSPDVITQVISTISGRTMLFINGNNSRYASEYLNGDSAASYAATLGNSHPQLNASL